MSCIELTRIQVADQDLRKAGIVSMDTGQIAARAQTRHYSVLYLRSGQKVFVQETLDEIDRLIQLKGAERVLVRRFKRAMRECKGLGIPVDQAFAALWEEIATESNLPESRQGSLYQELVNWTKRWLK